MEFGPEIKVDGKRPEWLEDNDEIDIRWSDGAWFSAEDCGPVAVRNIHWGNATGIRLPANHPHYTAPTADERAVAPELVERMRKLVEDIVARDNENRNSGMFAEYESGPLFDEARAIVAALEPVDPMLLEARQVVADLYTSNAPHLRERALSGEGDEWFHTKVARAALARGRQLQRDSVTGVTLGTREQFEKDCI